jgi:hypothetical protein
MMTRAILWPTFAMVVLIFFVAAAMLHHRLRHMRHHPPAGADFASGDATRRYFQPVELPSANLANLFEMPVLFFALVPLLLVTVQAGVAQVALAWGYVALRAGHSIAHVTRRVRLRFALFLASNAVLAAMWIGFAVDIGFSSR